jgi:hypothetical protein
MAEYVKSIPDFEKAFQLRDRWLRCIDEGCPGGVHLAGSGILLGEEAVKIARAAGVTAVTSHEECGAALLAAKRAGVADAETYAKDFSSRLAKRLGLFYDHLPISGMARPVGLHVARAVYYDGTGHFDPSRCGALPPGFVISRRYLTPVAARRECEIAVNIALGPHGFGERFSPTHPLLLVGIADPAAPWLPVGALRSELAAIARDFSGRVTVDSWVGGSQAAGLGARIAPKQPVW